MGPLNNNLQIPGLTLDKEIGRGAQSIVYRARRGEKTYAVKIFQRSMVGEGESAEEMAVRFRREAQVLARVHHAGLPAVMEIGEDDGCPYLVMEHVEGQTLASLIEKGPLPEPHIITLARVLAGALGRVHAFGLVHRDLKPRNIILDAASNIWLIDFGLASYAQEQQIPDRAIGTFLYSAPEQTGMLKRPVDGRSDLYSLGVVLFECASGRPPFYSDEAGELMRMHVTLAPPDLHKLRPDLSPALHAVIAKLLAKDPEDRYQSGASLIADLDDLSNLNSILKSNEEIVLDTFEVQSLGPPLIGRQTELAALQGVWQKVLSGQGNAALVEGDPGSGKSRLVSEFLNTVRREGKMVLMSKAEPSDPLPFAVLRSLVEAYFARIKRIPGEQRGSLLDRLCRLTSDMAPFLKSFSPALKVFYKDFPEAIKQEEGPEAFLHALAHFLLAIPKLHRETVFFLDDLQWLDEGSRRVLQIVAGKLQEYPLFLLHARRPDPIGAFPELDPLISLRLPLDLLNEAEVGALISAHLGGQEVNRIFVHQIAARSEGNPFGVGEYITAMLEAGLLRPSWGTWLVDSEGLEKLALPSDVLQLILSRVKHLGPAADKVLTAAAVIGLYFRLEYLPQICGVELEEIYGAIEEATRAHLIERGKIGEYRFVHDQICEALLSKLPAPSLRSLHQRVAEVFDELEGQNPEHIFSLAQHYSQGEVRENPKRVYETNFMAGSLASKHSAPGQAYVFFGQAHEAAQLAQLPLDSNLEESWGVVCFQTSRLSEAKTHYQNVLKIIKDPFVRSRIRSRLSWVYISDLDLSGAEGEIKMAFAEVGKRYPKENLFSLLALLWKWVLWVFLDRFGLFYGIIRGRKRILYERHISLWLSFSFLAYYRFRPLLYLQGLFQLMLPSHLLGDSFISVKPYGACAAVLANFNRPRFAEKNALKALHIAQKINDRYATAQAKLYHSYYKTYLGLDREAAVYAIRCLEEYGPWLDEGDYINNVGSLSRELVVRGYAAEALKWIQKTIQKLKAIESPSNITKSRLDHMYFLALPCLVMLGRMTEADQYFAKLKDSFDKSENFPTFFWALFLECLMSYYLEQGEIGPPVEKVISEFEKLNIPPQIADYPTRFYYVLLAYCRLAQYQEARSKDGAGAFLKLKQALKILKKVARPHDNYLCHQIIIESILERMNGNSKKALVQLASAEEQANRADNAWAIYEIAAERAYIFRALGDQAAALRQAYIAYNLAQYHGWTRRAHRMLTEFQLIPSVGSRYATSTPSTGRPLDASALTLQRYLDALLRLSLAVVSVFDPEQQVRSVLTEIMRIFGAERAFLFLCREGSDGLELKAGRDAQGANLSDLKGYSATVVEEVYRSRRPVVVSGSANGPLANTKSMVAYGIRSIMAAPLIVRDHFLGVIYLDNRLSRGVFSHEDIGILQAMANHLAIAIDATRLAWIELESQSLERANVILEEKVKERTRELREAQAEIIQAGKMAALGRLGAGIAHELKTPLTAIRGFVELILPEVKANDPYYQKLGIIERQTQRMIRIIENIRTFSRQSEFKLEPASILRPLEDALALFSEQLKEHKISVVRNISADLPPVMLDTNRMQQVFINLITNALDAIDELAGIAGGEIRIEALHLSDKNKLEIKFSDTGCGISPDILDKIFEPFFTTKEAASGTGLGLSIVYGIIKDHHGSINVRSEKGEGTTFSIELPALK